MESFRHLYIESSQSLKMKPDETLLSRIDDGAGDFNVSLNLSCCEFSEEICKAVGTALSNDVHLMELDFSNCMLPQEGLLHILSGLERNRFLLTLNLKGNNIRSHGAQAIGKLLRHNNHLQNLYLEWNGVGILPEKFALLCEGLIANTSLKELDLKNNQLNHVCAVSMSDVLYRNSTLQKLDLCWNNMGLTGGRALLKAFTKNKSVIDIKISGNEIPSEILLSIMIACESNAKQHVMRNEQIEQTKSLTNMLHEQKQKQDLQVKSLLKDIEQKNREEMEKQRWSTLKFEELQEALREKNSALESVTEKCHMLKTSLASTTEKLNDMATHISDVEERNRDLKAEQYSSLERERKERDDMQKRLLFDISSLKEENLSLKQQVQDLTALNSHSKEQQKHLEDKIANLDSQRKFDESHFTEKISSLKDTNAELLRESAMTRKTEVSRLKQDFTEAEQKLQNHIRSLESRIKDLEQENEKIRDIAESNQMRSEDTLCQLQIRMKADEEKMKKQLEEKIDMIEKAKQKQEKLLQEHLDIMYELKKKSTALGLEISEKNIKIQQLQKSLSAKDSEQVVAVAKARLEAKEQVDHLIKENEMLKLSCQEVVDLKKQFTEAEEMYKKENMVKDDVMKNLKRELEQIENQVKKMSEDEAHRASQLQRAFDSYLKSGQHGQKLRISEAGDMG